VAISKRDQSRASAGDDLVAEQCSITARLPQLWEFLVTTTFSDGSSRILPTLTLFIEGRMLKACLNDRAEGVVAFATGSSLSSILEALEEGIAADTLDWRKSNGSGRRK
jgi:hypothetical protein